MIISFAGHSSITSHNKVKAVVKEQIKRSVTDTDKIIFYLGGYGDFDNICAMACKEIKGERDGIEIVYVTPYISLYGQEKIKERLSSGLYDTSLYPPIENTPPRFAISKRNEWMMSNADLIIAYVDHNFGGAYRSLQIAKMKKKRIINICELL